MVSANFDFIYESLKSKFNVIPLIFILTFGCSKKNKEEEKKKQSGWKFNPVLALISLQTTGPWWDEEPPSLWASSATGRSGGGVGKGTRTCNYVSGIWISASKIDVKCWLVEMTLVMTSVPSLTWFSMFVYIHTCFRFALIGGNLTAQSTWCHRGILRQNSSSRDMVASSLSFDCPAPRVPQRACSQAKNPSASRGC